MSVLRRTVFTGPVAVVLLVLGLCSVAWDGVKRDVEIANRPHMKGSIHLMSGFSGKMECTELRSM